MVIVRAKIKAYSNLRLKNPIIVINPTNKMAIPIYCSFCKFLAINESLDPEGVSSILLVFRVEYWYEFISCRDAETQKVWIVKICCFVIFINPVFLPDIDDREKM